MASKRIVSSVAAALVLGVMSVGPALGKASPSVAATGSAASTGKTTFTVGSLSSLKTVNPIKALNDVEYEFLNLNYDLSLRFALNNLAASPGIVQSWTHSTDGMTWTYNLW